MKRWDLSVRELSAGRWEAVATGGWPHAIMLLAGRGPTRDEAITELRLKVAAFDAMANDGAAA